MSEAAHLAKSHLEGLHALRPHHLHLLAAAAADVERGHGIDAAPAWTAWVGAGGDGQPPMRESHMQTVLYVCNASEPTEVRRVRMPVAFTGMSPAARCAPALLCSNHPPAHLCFASLSSPATTAAASWLPSHTSPSLAHRWEQERTVKLNLQAKRVACWLALLPPSSWYTRFTLTAPICPSQPCRSLAQQAQLAGSVQQLPPLRHVCALLVAAAQRV